ncbi:MAG TPA: UDP-N-acetylmuramoyl-L-alanyl-D-glutamate--2,6-diaminopimelate ligase [Acidobacteriota bacterium]|nr:UDP-N-acetylmuramoyl-L-alanyl-D-glutamate--2,6-diaminopimelate ligase [Acidobacteriota bacterium]
MRLNELIAGVEGASLEGDGAVEVTGLEFDSRRVGPGSLFAALVGEKVDGNRFIGAAVEAGAAAVLSERAKPDGLNAVWIEVPDARAALAVVSKRWFGAPDEELKLACITGTNGKTSVAHLLQTVLGNLNGPSGRLGTISYHTGREEVAAPLTTPEAPDIFRMLREMRDAGCRSAAMEASSHAIDRKRVEGIAFDSVTFTNLSRDHLDYHGDMENYYRAKRKIFCKRDGYSPVAAINADDEWGRRLLAETGLHAVSFGFSHDAQVCGKNLRLGLDGTSFTVCTEQGEFELRSQLIGRPNGENLLAAFATAHALGFDGEDIAAAIAGMKTVRGRLERLPSDRPFEVIVDYAHTDDALRRLLLTAGELAPDGGRVIVLFGCGGDRDRGKRPLMGRHAITLADIAILTSDNPRSEDPMAIIREVEAGIAEVVQRRAEYKMIPDRAEAIKAAVGMARAGDLVLISGKGHEDYQIIGDKRLHFDDREEVLKALAEL